MLPAVRLFAFGMRHVIGGGPENDAQGGLEKGSSAISDVVAAQYARHSTALPRALARANDSAWHTMSICLAGSECLDQIKAMLASDEHNGSWEGARLFLEDKNLGFECASIDERKKCLTELKEARKVNVLTAQDVSATDVAYQSANARRFNDPEDMQDGAEQLIGQIAEDLAKEYPRLGALLGQRPSGVPPLLVSAFTFFFGREVEADHELARSLCFDGLRELFASQANALEEIGKALGPLGDRCDELIGRVIEHLGRSERGVLDIESELQQLGGLRRLAQDVLNREIHAGIHKGEVRSHHSFSIRDAEERAAVKKLLVRFGQLPTQQQGLVPALLNGLGKLQFGSGDFQGAQHTFIAVVEQAQSAAGQAEGHFNAFRAALEATRWDEALAAIQRAASLDPQRFALFPMERYQPKEILGAGAFGTVFRCHDVTSDEEVVVKTLDGAATDRSVTELFREAQLLRQISHPAIIKIRACEYADRLNHARPYFVTEYFAGSSLETVVQRNGTLRPEDLLCVCHQIASAMHVIHQEGILHGELKPDNVLVRKEGASWRAKIIDVGLTLQTHTIETAVAARSAGNTILGDSVARTVKYAALEQLGEMNGVEPGPYSDVYAFGKLCYYALFKTTEPTNRLWRTLPEAVHTGLRELLEQCQEQDLQYRLPSFEPILKTLELLDPLQSQRQKEEEARHRAEMEKLARDKLARRRDRAQDGAGQVISVCTPKRTPGDVIHNSVGMTFAWIPPGTFLMGSPKDELHRSGNELQHTVTLTHGFYMAVHPITRGHFTSFVDDSRYRTQAEREGGAHVWTGTEWKLDATLNWRHPGFEQADDHPAVCISWSDAVAYAAWLSNNDARPYRLPTEAEWEYACRAGTLTPFHFGQTLSTDQANYNGVYTYGDGAKGVFRDKTTSVGSFPANDWGLFDMHGNAFEWCQDWYSEYPRDPVVDPRGPTTGQYHVLRGGSCIYWPQCCRSAYRIRSGRRHRFDCYFGFRLCYSAE